MSERLQRILGETLAYRAARGDDELEYIKATRGMRSAALSYAEGWNDCLLYLAQRTQTQPDDDMLELLAYRRAVSEGVGQNGLWIVNRMRELVKQWQTTR